MRQSNVPKTRNLYNLKNLTTDKKYTANVIINKNHDNEEEEDEIKKIKKLILTKNLFSLKQGFTDDLNFALFPSKRNSNYGLRANKDFKNLYLDDNSIFYDEFLNKLKEENKLESRKKFKKIDNNSELITINRTDKDYIPDTCNTRSPKIADKLDIPRLPLTNKKKNKIDEGKNIIKNRDNNECLENQVSPTENFKVNKQEYKNISEIKILESTVDDKLDNRKSNKNIPHMESNLKMRINSNYNELNKSSPKVLLENDKNPIKRLFKINNSNLKLPKIACDIKKTILHNAPKNLSNCSLNIQQSFKKDEVCENNLRESVPFKPEENKEIGISFDSFVNNIKENKQKSFKKKPFCGCFPIFN